MVSLKGQDEGIIRLTRRGTVFSGSTAELHQLAAQFEEANYVRLRNLIDSRVLHSVVDRIDKAEFRPRTHKNIGQESSLNDDRTLHILRFLVMNSDFFCLVERITSCQKIGFFDGRVYRFVAGDGHFDEWHNDLIEDRLVGLSVNLSPQPYAGGNLELRDNRSGEIREVHNTGFGDAILFRLDWYMHHRVGKVQGDFPKTAFAGWFKSKPDFFARLQTNRKESP